MQAGSLYYHFDSREALVEEILILGVQDSWAQVAKGMLTVEAESSKVRLATALRCHTLAVLDDRLYTGALAGLLSQVPLVARTRHMESHKEYGEYFGGLFDLAHSDGHLTAGSKPQLLRILAMSAPVQLAGWRFNALDHGLVVEDIVDELLRMVFAQPPV